MVKLFCIVLLNWFVVDVCSLVSTAKTLKLNCSRAKVFVWVSLIVCLKSLVFVFGKVHFLRLLILLFSQIVLSLLVFCSQKTTSFLRILLVIFTYVFLMYGVEWAFLFCFEMNIESLFSFFVLPIWGLAVCCLVYCCLAGSLRGLFRSSKIIGQLFRKVKLTLFGNDIDLVGYIDSGNMLKENSSGAPVLILSREKLKKKISKEMFQMLEEKNLEKLIGDKVREVKYSTLSGFCSKMYVIRPESLVLTNGEKSKGVRDCFIGIVDYPFRKFDILLSRECI